MNDLARAIDNPIFLRGVFGRVRFPGAWIGLGIVLVLSLFFLGAAGAVAGMAQGGTHGHTPFDERLSKAMLGALWALFLLEWLLLLPMACSAIASVVSSERESGVLDLIRMAPQPAWRMVAGYVFGIPAREHFLAGVTLPFAAAAGLLSRVPLNRLAAMYAVLYASAVFFQLLSMLIGLTVRRPRTATGLAVSLLLLYHLFLGWFFPHLSAFPSATWALVAGDRRAAVSFFGESVPVPAFALAILGALAAFLALAAMRKFRSPERPSWSKIQALVFALLVQLVLLGVFFDDLHRGGSRGSSIWSVLPRSVELAYGWLAYAFALGMVAMGTPGAPLYALSARRAMRQGRIRLGLLAEGAPNTFFLVGLVTPLLAAIPLLPPGFGGRIVIPLISASSVLMVGAALQWTRLRFGRRWLPVTVGVMFLLWGLPLMGGILAGMVRADPVVVHMVGGLFPGFGLTHATEPEAGLSSMILVTLNLGLAALFVAWAARDRKNYWRKAPPLPPATRERRAPGAVETAG